MFRSIVVVLILVSFSFISSFATTEEKEEEMGIFLNAISICSKEDPVKCASFVKKSLSRVKTEKSLTDCFFFTLILFSNWETPPS